MEAVSLKALSYCFKAQKVLDEVSLNLEENKIYGLLGKNGAGKTTLLNSMVNQLIAPEGEILLWGKDPRVETEVLEKVCIVREAEFCSPEMKVKAIFKLYEGFYPNYNKALQQRLVDFFNLPLQKAYKSYSRGMKSMVFNIIGLCSGAALTIFDEPTLGLDAETREQFYQRLLETYNETPRTFILSTHLIEEIEHLIEEVIILHEGKIVLHEAVEDLKACYLSGREEALQKLEALQGKSPKQSFGKRQVYTCLEALSQQDEAKIAQYGIEKTPMGLQKLFIELTKGRDYEYE